MANPTKTPEFYQASFRWIALLLMQMVAHSHEQLPFVPPIPFSKNLLSPIGPLNPFNPLNPLNPLNPSNPVNVLTSLSRGEAPKLFIPNFLSGDNPLTDGEIFFLDDFFKSFLPGNTAQGGSKSITTPKTSATTTTTSTTAKTTTAYPDSSTIQSRINEKVLQLLGKGGLLLTLSRSNGAKSTAIIRTILQVNSGFA